ncbi:MAG: cytochrome P450 [Candidatus Obscuribacterales bacterium]
MPQTKLTDPLNPITDEFLQDPYPTFSRLQKEEPVYWSEKSKYFIITRYEDVFGILKDNTYGKRLQQWKQVNPVVKLVPQVSKMMKSRSLWMLNQDQPDHTRLRGLVNKAFTPSMIGNMKAHIAEIADYLLSGLKDRDEFDLVTEYAFPLPVTVIAEMLGVPSEDRDKFRHWSTQMTETLEPTPNLEHMKKSNAANEELIDYLRPLVAKRRQDPKDDLISALIHAEEEGNKLTEDELLGNCVLILVAGHETTVNLIGNSVRCLLSHPDQLALLKSQSELLPKAINEVLRYESPVQLVRRLAGQETELRGKKIKEKDMLVLLLGAANRDPDEFENADKFDITRDVKKHLAFGHGIHHCLGSSLAEAEGEIAIDHLFKTFPDLALKTDKITIRKPFALRGPKELLVRPCQ